MNRILVNSAELHIDYSSPENQAAIERNLQAIREWQEPGPKPELVERRCGACGKMQSIGLFNRANRSKDGYQSSCTVCLAKNRSIDKDRRDKGLMRRGKFA
jgi:hypothetical protein